MSCTFANGTGSSKPYLFNADNVARFATPSPGSVPALSAPNAQAVRSRDVWLVHPWALRDLPADLAPNTLCVAAFIAQIHAEHAWSAARWNFVATRMAELASVHWFGSTAELATGLSAARSVQTVASAHLGDHLSPQLACRPVARLFPAVATRCDSFSRWWSRATRQVRKVSDLPGLSPAPADPDTAGLRGDVRAFSATIQPQPNTSS